MLDLPIMQSQTQTARGTVSGATKAPDDSATDPESAAFENEYNETGGVDERSDKASGDETEIVNDDTAKSVIEPEDMPTPDTVAGDLAVTVKDPVENDPALKDTPAFALADATGRARASKSEDAINKADASTNLPYSAASAKDRQARITGTAQAREEQTQGLSIAAPVEKRGQPSPNRSTVETVVMTLARDATTKQADASFKRTMHSATAPDPAHAANQSPPGELRSAPATVPTAQPEAVRATIHAPAQPNDRQDSLRSDRDITSYTVERPPVRAPATTPVLAAQIGASQIAQSRLVAVQGSSEFVNFISDDPDIAAPFDQRISPHAHSAQLQQVLHRAETPAMVARQIAQALQKLPDRPVEISLNPKELGRVRMNISAAEAGITVSVIAERPETLDLMRRNIDQLAREFDMIGYNDINFAFSQGETQQEFSDERAEAPQTSSNRLDLDHPSDIKPNRLAPLPTTGVDIRV